MKRFYGIFFIFFLTLCFTREGRVASWAPCEPTGHAGSPSFQTYPSENEAFTVQAVIQSSWIARPIHWMKEAVKLTNELHRGWIRIRLVRPVDGLPFAWPVFHRENPIQPIQFVQTDESRQSDARPAQKRILRVLLVGEPAERVYPKSLLRRLPYLYETADPLITEMDDSDSVLKEFVQAHHQGTPFDFVLIRKSKNIRLYILISEIHRLSYASIVILPDDHLDPTFTERLKIDDDHVVCVQPTFDENRFFRIIREDFNLNRVDEGSPQPSQILRALIIDDHEVEREPNRAAVLDYAVRAGIGPSNLHIALRDDGAQGLKTYQQARKAGYPYHLVITDSQMPKMMGSEFAQRVRADEARRGDRQVPIIMVQGGASEDSLIPVGVTAILGKSLYKYGPNELLIATIKRFLTAAHISNSNVFRKGDKKEREAA